MKFVVAQIGARRGYAVPAILENAGLLERFYTDITGDVGLGKILSAATTLPWIRKAACRLAGRRLPQSIRSKTETFPGITLLHGSRSIFGSHDSISVFRQAMNFSDALGRAMARRSFGNATHMYSMLAECGPLLIAAKQRGLTVVSEVYIPLSTESLIAEERRKFPDWGPEAADFATVRRQLGIEDVLLKYSDYFICSSEVVREDLVGRWGVQRERIALVPYGMDPRWLEIKPQPVRGRVLFAGTADLRKGIHYFALAAEKLARRGLHYEFRVAGNVTERVANRSECRHLTFLGRIPRAKMALEFAAADMFVLPSLAEASAEATYEALACAVPVITTLETGSVVRDGIEGRIIPSRQPQHLADAIVEIIEDRQKRERMAAAARERARDYTWDRYGERLITALKGFAAGKIQTDSDS